MSSSHTTVTSSDRRGSIAMADRRGSIIVGGGGGKITMNNTKTASMAKSRVSISISNRRRGSIMPGGGGGMVGDKSSIHVHGGHHKKKHIRIMDGDVDVTPQPLLQVDPYMAKQNRSYIGGGTGSESGTGLMGMGGLNTPTDGHSQMSAMQHSALGGTMMGGMTFGAAMSKPVWASGEESHRSSRDSVADDYSEAGVAEPQALGLAEVTTKHGEEIQEQITEEDKEKNVDIILTETPTFWILDIPGKCVEAGTDEVEVVKEQNAKYQKLIKDRVGNDLYAQRGMQTFNNGRKVKHAQTDKVLTADQLSMAATWDMYDTYLDIAEDQQEKQDEEPEILGGETSRADSPTGGDDGTASVAGSTATSKGGGSYVETKTATGNVSVVRSVQASVAATNEEGVPPGDSIFAGSSLGNAVTMTESSMINKESPEELLKQMSDSESFLKNLFIMERIVVQNIYQPKLAIYRNLPVYPDVDAYIALESADEISSLNYQRMNSESFNATAKSVNSTSILSYGPHLEKLWSFSCDLTKNYTVLCMSWNKSNPDILVVGYGQSTYRGQSEGLVCCWSIKNIEYPERVYKVESGATSVGFSASHPNLLGVGTYDGSVCVFDVGVKSADPVLDNFDSPGKHTGPVWHLVWVEKERSSGDDKGQILVSISADGRVCQWSIKKGFEYLEVMKLKRVFQSKSSSKSTGSESLINRFSSGMGLDFKASDSNLYIAGTEDGNIHKCSCSYNEQFLSTYNGHSGPVYKVTWSPFAGDIFLSASADWSIKVWHQDMTEPVINIQPALKAVTDINWSPISSTIFGCTTEDAVQIFDLESSIIDPIVTHPVENKKLTAFQFAHNSPCVLFGDSQGEVAVMKVHNVFTEDQEKIASGWSKDAEQVNDPRLSEIVGSTLNRESEVKAKNAPSESQ
ncbi:dynein axonemal intermediate chain 4-like isoform X2 [Symsagittifera roscoffensis]|uniref:dynein axonemal intermediate chain 4-like isoform X2 n=1 Tax=Symsagittifera roscoffensis TaxID=84072 RepID=UPI00307C9BA5